MDTTDWLSRLLELVPVSGKAEHRCFFGAPWQLDDKGAAPGEIPYHIVLAGSASLDAADGSPSRRLKAGDILLLPHGTAHILSDGSGQAASPIRVRRGPTILIDENDGEGERIDMLCGRFVLSVAHARLVRDHLPATLVVSAAEHSLGAARPGAAAQLANLVGLMRTESAEENLGGQAMLSALSTAMFALTLRLASEGEAAPTGLLALAGHPRLAPALSAIFDTPERPWTLPELADRCGMSRATFIRQFQQALGRSAADLLTDVRMTVAANTLRNTHTSTGAVAEAAGYQSEAAFQRVFKHYMGVTPAQYRRQAHAEALVAP